MIGIHAFKIDFSCFSSFKLSVKQFVFSFYTLYTVLIVAQNLSGFFFKKKKMLRNIKFELNSNKKNSMHSIASAKPSVVLFLQIDKLRAFKAFRRIFYSKN